MPHDAAEQMLKIKVPIIEREVPTIVHELLDEWDNEDNYDKILKEMDADHDGSVDKNEFVGIYSKKNI